MNGSLDPSDFLQMPNQNRLDRTRLHRSFLPRLALVYTSIPAKERSKPRQVYCDGGSVTPHRNIPSHTATTSKSLHKYFEQTLAKSWSVQVKTALQN